MDINKFVDSLSAIQLWLGATEDDYENIKFQAIKTAPNVLELVEWHHIPAISKLFTPKSNLFYANWMKWPIERNHSSLTWSNRCMVIDFLCKTIKKNKKFVTPVDLMKILSSIENDEERSYVLLKISLYGGIQGLINVEIAWKIYDTFKEYRRKNVLEVLAQHMVQDDINAIIEREPDKIYRFSLDHIKAGPNKFFTLY